VAAFVHFPSAMAKIMIHQNIGTREQILNIQTKVSVAALIDTPSAVMHFTK
jgi:hypothetical protein